jgi:hypothetical protein
MALAALGAAAVLDVGSATAEAAASVSRFAGTYVPADPSSTWTYTISDGGQITGSYLFGSYVIEGSLSGRVRDDGSYSYTQTQSSYSEGRGGQTRKVTSRTTYSGSMELDASGNIIVTPSFGSSFVWLRQ